jgi:hypothetical protein
MRWDRQAHSHPWLYRPPGGKIGEQMNILNLKNLIFCVQKILNL